MIGDCAKITIDELAAILAHDTSLWRHATWCRLAARVEAFAQAAAAAA